MKHFIGFILLILSLPGFSQLNNKLYHLNIKSDNGLIHSRLLIDKDDYYIINGDEKIKLKKSIENDSLILHFPVFNSELYLKPINDNSFIGFWYNNHKGYKLPISAYSISYTPQSMLNTEKYECKFFDDSGDSYPAILTLRYNNYHCQGTIQTETGDYRYLSGTKSNDSYTLSTFDGSHCFQFNFNINEKKELTKGVFLSGKAYKENFTGYLNAKASLTNPYDITHKTDAKPSFIFPNHLNILDSLSNPAYLNKVVVIQIMGTWCPNCMDESKYLIKLKEELKSEAFEIIALAFEAKDNFDYASSRVKTFINDLNINYPVLIAGVSNKQKASAQIPWLDGIKSFPTTVILNKNHEIISIYSGFNGPGTGKDYINYTNQTKEQILKLLK